jgi:MoaA/NifB/PqqE/SkfB family radical SAM enzyme
LPKDYAINRIREAKELGVTHVIFSGGEPTLHPDFFEIFNEVKKQDMGVSIVTSGSFVNEKILNEFTDYPRSYWVFSFDCADENINDYYRDKGSFKYVVETIRRVRQRDPSKWILINTILVRETLEYVEKTAKFLLEDLNVNSMHVERVVTAGLPDRISKKIKINDYKYYASRINPLIKKYPGRFNTYTYNLSWCCLDRKSDFMLFIFPDKKIYFCCYTPDKMMEIGDENTMLADLMKGNRISNTAREIHSKIFCNSSEIRNKNGIFGCVECIEEYNKFKESDKLNDMSAKGESTNFLKTITQKIKFWRK